MALDIISRQEAIRAGLKYYYNGVPCKFGHLAERAVKSPGCRECNRLRSKAWCDEHADEVRIRLKKLYEDTKEKAQADSRVRYEGNKQAYIDRAKAWKLRNPDKVKAQSASYLAKNLDKHRAKEAKRRTQKMGTACEHHTAADVRSILASQGFKCAYCKKGIRKHFHADHITPLSKGGSNAKHNIQVLCPKCNLSKGAQHPIEFARKIGLLI